MNFKGSERKPTWFDQDIVPGFAKKGARGILEVKALCYKPEGPGFDTQWGE
jgi:hypothetical protein